MIYWLLAFLLIGLQIPDIVSTNRIILSGGREMNPVVRWLMRRLHHRWWWPKMAFAVVGASGLAMIHDRDSLLGLIALNIIYGVVVWSNYRQMRRMNI